jgi:hypothetical protein
MDKLVSNGGELMTPAEFEHFRLEDEKLDKELQELNDEDEDV